MRECVLKRKLYIDYDGKFGYGISKEGIRRGENTIDNSIPAFLIKCSKLYAGRGKLMKLFSFFKSNRNFDCATKYFIIFYDFSTSINYIIDENDVIIDLSSIYGSLISALRILVPCGTLLFVPWCNTLQCAK